MQNNTYNNLTTWLTTDHSNPGSVVASYATGSGSWGGWHFIHTDPNFPDPWDIFAYSLYKLSILGTDEHFFLDYRDDRIGFYGVLGNPIGHPIDIWVKYFNGDFYISNNQSSWAIVPNGTTINFWDLKGMGSPSTGKFQPYSPENLTNTIVNNKPKLVWQHHSPAEDYWVGYEIYRCITTTGTTPTNFTYLSTVSKYTTNYIDYNLNLSGTQTAYYKVKTKNTSKLSEFSNQTSFCLNPPPTAPQNLDVTSNGTHPVVSWNANQEPDLGGYYIYKSVNYTEFYQTATLSSNDTSWIDYDVTFTKPIWSVKIEYKAKAFDTQGNTSPFSNTDYIYGKDNPLPKNNFQDSIKITTIVYENNISNYPNPFNPTTVIEYEISENNFIKLNVFNSIGQEVAKLVNEFKIAGKYQVQFDGTKLPSGVYYYKIESSNFTNIKKMLLIK